MYLTHPDVDAPGAARLAVLIGKQPPEDDLPENAGKKYYVGAWHCGNKAAYRATQ